MDVSSSQLASSTMSVYKAQTGADILQKTLQKTEESNQSQGNARSQVAAFTGKGQNLNVIA